MSVCRWDIADEHETPCCALRSESGAVAVFVNPRARDSEVMGLAGSEVECDTHRTPHVRHWLIGDLIELALQRNSKTQMATPYNNPTPRVSLIPPYSP
jgi:hypothetical protein